MQQHLPQVTMDRKTFLKSLSLLSLTGYSMKLHALNQLTASLPDTPPLPVLFLGHGSPMNAIEDNEFSRGWRKQGADLPRPSAILCISAHWETKGTFVTAMEHPKTIHDFGGFPPELYAVEYPAPGSPLLAGETRKTVTSTSVGLDTGQWGLDHGAWSVIRHLYPDADVPVVQLSLDYGLSPAAHYDLAKELAALRRKGVLIVGSGNMVHNLRKVAWDKMNAPDFAFDWAREASDRMKQMVLSGDHKALINYKSGGTAFDLAVPTPEHFLPLLYVLALQGERDSVSLFNDKAVMGSLTMTCVKVAAG
jgi:4,5-DOPA dioxygenase extradiol